MKVASTGSMFKANFAREIYDSLGIHKEQTNFISYRQRRPTA